MSHCTRCGAHIPEGESKCPACGYEPEGRAEDTSHVEYEIFDGENEKTRRMSALCYVGPLFFVPLLLDGKREYIRFHANQGLALFLCELVAFGLLGGLIGVALEIGCIYLAVQGVKNAAQGNKTKLPYIGNWKLIKEHK